MVDRDEILRPADEASQRLIDDQKIMGGLTLQETINVPLQIPEISPERKAFYVERDPNTTYGVFCSDDRGATEDSAKLLLEKYGLSGEVFLRTYGGKAGVARRLATAIAVQYGAETLAQYGTSFTDFQNETADRIERVNKVILGGHSAESNESNPTELNLDSEKGLGCAYCGGIGAVTCLCEPDSDLIPMAREEHTALFGDDSLVEPIAQGNLAVEKQFFAVERDKFALSRKDLSATDMPIMILAGSHAKAHDTEVVLNLDAAKVSQPGKANEANLPYYSVDAAAEAEMLIKAYPELQLQPKILLAVSLDDARAVREALAGSEGLHADSLKLVRNGSVEQAIAYLEGIAA